MKNSNKLIILTCLLLLSGLVYSNLKLKTIYDKSKTTEKDFISKYSKFNHIKLKGNGITINLIQNLIRGKDSPEPVFLNIRTMRNVLHFEMKKDTLIANCKECNQADGSILEYKFSLTIPSISSVECDSAKIELTNFKLNDLKIKANHAAIIVDNCEIENLESKLRNRSNLNFTSKSKVKNALFVSKDSSSIRISELEVKNLKIDASKNSKIEGLLKNL